MTETNVLWIALPVGIVALVLKVLIIHNCQSHPYYRHSEWFTFHRSWLVRLFRRTP
jgi:hypothetical protein